MRTILRRIVIALCTCASLSAPFIAFAACGRAQQQSAVRGHTEKRPRHVSSNRVEPHQRDAGWLGVVLPGHSLELAPEIPGQVLNIYVREGDSIRRGQTLAVLGSVQDQQELTIAQVNLRAAEAEVSRNQLDLAEADNRLSNRLAMPDAFPKEEIRRSEIQKQIAQVNLEGARARALGEQARLNQARERLAKAEIRAPADGTVARRYVEPGAQAGPGQPVIRMIGSGSAIVRFAAPPEQAVSLRAGAHVTIATDAGSVPAVIDSVSPELDAPSGMLIVVATLDAAPAVKPGSVVRVYCTNASAARREGAG